MANFYGDDTDDRVFGGFVNFYGGDGDDFMQGDAAANALYGGEGNDVLNGSLYLTYLGEGTLASPYVITSFDRPLTPASLASRHVRAAKPSPRTRGEVMGRYPVS